jgi:nucleotide-binding universal stress UspA family protein
MNVTTAPVVVGVDGTSGSAGALRYAVREARLRQTELRIVHVVPIAQPMSPMRPVVPIDLRPYGLKTLERALADVRQEDPDLEATTRLVLGARVRGIVDASADAQLVVLGRESRHGFERLLTGATTAGVAARAGCPTVAVPDTWSPRESGTHVVVGLRSTTGARDLFATAFAWASARRGHVTAIHAWELPDAYVDGIEARTNAEQWDAEGRRILDEALAPWRDRYPEVTVETRVVHGQPAAVLATAAKQADLLLVYRAHEHRPFDHLGATVRALLLASATPVEVVPASKSGDRDELVLEQAGDIAK